MCIDYLNKMLGRHCFLLLYAWQQIKRMWVHVYCCYFSVSFCVIVNRWYVHGHWRH